MMDRMLKDPQATAYLLAVFTFMAVVLFSLIAQVYQTTTGKGQASAALTDNMKSAMLVLSGMLAASKLTGHKPDPEGTERDPVHTVVDNETDEAVPTKVVKPGQKP